MCGGTPVGASRVLCISWYTGSEPTYSTPLNCSSEQRRDAMHVGAGVMTLEGDLGAYLCVIC